MTNVVHLFGAHGAMRPRHHIRVGKLTEAEIDALLAATRAERIAAAGRRVPTGTTRPRRGLPTVTPTTRRGRLLAWVRAWF